MVMEQVRTVQVSLLRTPLWVTDVSEAERFTVACVCEKEKGLWRVVGVEGLPPLGRIERGLVARALRQALERELGERVCIARGLWET